VEVMVTKIATDPKAVIEALEARGAAIKRAEKAEAQNAKLREVLELYRDAVSIDVTMGGPVVMGVIRSRLKRAWEHDRAALAAEKVEAENEQLKKEISGNYKTYARSTAAQMSLVRAITVKNAQLREVLDTAAGWFEEYAYTHSLKETSEGNDKARRNQARARARALRAALDEAVPEIEAARLAAPSLPEPGE
jgi:hypothetical protein